VGLDYIHNGLSSFRCGVWSDYKVCCEFREIPFVVPLVDIGSVIDKRCRGVTDCFTILFKLKNTIINVVAVVHGDITIHGFGAPNLWWDVNHKGGREVDGINFF
jgi:hypothetical protein